MYVTSLRGGGEDVVEVQRYLDTLKAYHMPGHQTGIAGLQSRIFHLEG